MDIINSLVDNNQKVDEKIINIGNINDSKYEDIVTIRQKLIDFKTEISSKFTQLLQNIKDRIEEIDKKIAADTTANKLLIKENPIKVANLDGIKLDNLLIIKDKLIEIYQKVQNTERVIELKPKEAKEYLLKKLETMRYAASVFKCIDLYNDTQTNINDIPETNLTEEQKASLVLFIKNIAIVQTAIEKGLAMYNKNNKDVLTDIKNNVQYLNLVGDNEGDYKFVSEKFFDIKFAFDINDADYKDLDVTFTEEQKNERDEFIKNLKENYDSKVKDFKEEIKKKLDLLKDIYSQANYELCNEKEISDAINFVDKKDVTCKQCGDKLKLIVKNIYDKITSITGNIANAKQSESIGADLKNALKDKFGIVVELSDYVFQPFSGLASSFYLKEYEKEKKYNELKGKIVKLFKDYKDASCYQSEYCEKCFECIKNILSENFQISSDDFAKFKYELEYKEKKESEKYLKIDKSKLKEYKVYEEIDVNAENLDYEKFELQEGVYYSLIIKYLEKSDIRGDFKKIPAYKKSNDINRLSRIINFIEKIYKHNITVLNNHVKKMVPILEYIKDLNERKLVEYNINDEYGYINVVSSEYSINDFINNKICEKYESIFKCVESFDFFCYNKSLEIDCMLNSEKKYIKSEKLFFNNFAFFKQCLDFYYKYLKNIKNIYSKNTYVIKDNEELENYLNKVLCEIDSEYKNIIDIECYFLSLFFIVDAKNYNNDNEFDVDKGFEVMDKLEKYFEAEKLKKSKK